MTNSHSNALISTKMEVGCQVLPYECKKVTLKQLPINFIRPLCSRVQFNKHGEGNKVLSFAKHKHEVIRSNSRLQFLLLSTTEYKRQPNLNSHTKYHRLLSV